MSQFRFRKYDDADLSVPLSTAVNKTRTMIVLCCFVLAFVCLASSARNQDRQFPNQGQVFSKLHSCGMTGPGLSGLDYSSNSKEFNIRKMNCKRANIMAG